VFKLASNTTKTAWTETVLHSFCASTESGCSRSGACEPRAGPIRDSAGNLYGTTQGGGGTVNSPSGAGTVFELSPNATKTAQTETVLYLFCSKGGCADGSGPLAGLIMDGSGNLYGTTYSGSAYWATSSGGTVFELIPNATNSAWTEAVLYSFCPKPAGCTDGKDPQAALILDGSGNLYGTAVFGGAGAPRMRASCLD
jgi:uncharacterized repeat protein (TIGR03803 family)